MRMMVDEEADDLKLIFSTLRECEGSWYPTHSAEKSGKDGARSFLCIESVMDVLVRGVWH
jgi:hypothetical protein